MRGAKKGSARRGPKPDRRHAQPASPGRETREPNRKRRAHGRARPPEPRTRTASPAKSNGRAANAQVEPSKLAAALAQAPAPLRVGEWLWTTREGAESDLIEELLLRAPAGPNPRKLAPSLVVSRGAPGLREGRLDLTFARQGFQVAALTAPDAHIEPSELFGPQLREALTPGERHALHVFVPDSSDGNGLSAGAQALREQLEPALRQLGGAGQELLDEAQLRRHGGMIMQVCVCDPATAAIGCIAAEQALSVWPGGRARMRLAGAFPSRAARKLAEAFTWLGMAPGSGELCVDLGAAPGGWSWLLLEKRARVIAVDPARMDAKLMRDPRLRHVQGNAFEYQPEEQVDWLFCDMAYRPLEVAQMLGRWARRRHTRLLVANFKLPMKRKVEMVERIRTILADAGFMSIRTRQLYHDREEITLTAHVR